MTDNVKKTAEAKVEKKTRGKVEKTVLLEILNENGEVVKVNPSQVKVLCVFTKANDEIFDLAMAHPAAVRIKI